jgi:hypothetical protein
VTLRCTVPRLEAALAEGPLSAPCGCGALVFAPGWWCDDCAVCAYPDLVRDCDEEDDRHQ